MPRLPSRKEKKKTPSRKKKIHRRVNPDPVTARLLSPFTFSFPPLRFAVARRRVSPCRPPDAAARLAAPLVLSVAAAPPLLPHSFRAVRRLSWPVVVSLRRCACLPGKPRRPRWPPRRFRPRRLSSAFFGCCHPGPLSCICCFRNTRFVACFDLLGFVCVPPRHRACPLLPPLFLI